MKVVYHQDTVEVWFSPSNKRYYTIWSQFLADAEAIFGDRMTESKAAGPARNGFGSRASANGMADHQAGFEAVAAVADVPPSSEMDALRREMKILERAIKVVGMQRDEWKKEADSLRQQLEISRAEVTQVLSANASLTAAAGGGGVDRYKQVRQVIVRRLHPDVPGTPEEKAYREKLFKTIWQEIEVLDKK